MLSLLFSLFFVVDQTSFLLWYKYFSALFSFFLWVCLWMCVHLFVYMLLMCLQVHVCIQIHVHICVSVGCCFSGAIYLAYLDREFPLAWNSLAWLGWLARKLMPSIYLSCLRIRPLLCPCDVFCDMRLLYWKGASVWKMAMRHFCDRHLKAHGHILIWK